MLGWFILGVCVVAALLLGARWFVSADPKVLARAVRWGAVALGGLVLILLAATRNLGWLLPMAVVALALYRRRRGFRFPSGWGSPAPGQSSDVETEYVAMTLDHDSGEMSGRVLSGRFAGRAFSDLGLDELIELWAECQLHDDEAARLVESYLDRTQAEDWRERVAGAAGGAEQAPRGAGAGPMTAEEARQVLGLEPGATPAQIKEAHHRLMQKIHPDHGGSSYLAVKINQAKEVLLRT